MSLLVWLPMTKDLSDQGLGGCTITNEGATLDNNGKLGKCYNFDGTNDRIKVSGLNNPKNITIAFWMKRNVTTNTRQFLFTAWNGVSIELGATNNLFGKIKTSSSEAGVAYGGTVTVDSGWIHVCYTFEDKVGGKMYINGMLTGSGDTTSSIAWNVTLGYIGNYSNIYLNAKLNDFRIYDHVLSAKEVKELSKGLVVHYPLDNNGQRDDSTYTDTTVYDTSGYNNHGTKNGTLTYGTSSARYGISTIFNGTATNYISAPSLPIETKTISCWIKCALGNNVALADYNTHLGIGLHGSDALITWAGTSNGGTGSRVALGNNWKTDEWNHVVIIITGTNTRTVYLNGVQLSPSSTNYWTHTTENLMIGRRSYSSYYFNGQLSDFRAYVTSLSVDDIMELYQTGASIDDKNRMYTYEYSEPSSDELLAVPYTTPFNSHTPTSSNMYTVRNSDGEYYFEGGSVSAGSQYIKINPSGKTYYYDTMVSISAGNRFYIGFERYDVNKTSRSNNACVYIVSEKPSSDLVKYRFTGTVNLATDGVNPTDTIAIRILNGWTGTDSSSTKKATIHYLSLREVDNSTGFETTSISKTGITKTDMLLEGGGKNIEKNSTINMQEFIEI